MKAHPNSQLSLALAPRPSWGGARAGAGRRPGKRPRVQHRARSRVRASHPCHVTLRIVRGLPSLRCKPLVRAFERTLQRGCERGSFRVVHYSLQRDHVHLIVEASDEGSLGRGMMSVGGRLARAVNRVFGRSGPVLADRYHVRALKTPREVRNALAYVLLNVRKHLASSRLLISRAAQIPDCASSGRWFDGWRRSPVLDSTRPSVARPRSWILAVGWKRHGLIDPCECPGAPRGHRPRRHPR